MTGPQASNESLREIVAGIPKSLQICHETIDGKISHVTDQEVYKKEPLNVTVYTGAHVINNNS